MNKTLREFSGVKPIQSIDPLKTALVLIDFQEEYFTGSLPLPLGKEAVKNAAKLVDWAEKNKIQVIHVHHVAGPQSPLFAAGTNNVKTHSALPIKEDHLRFEKNMPSVFINPSFHKTLQEKGIDQLIICGLMTHLCVDTNTRGALHFNYKVIVASDACATRDLPSVDRKTTISHQVIHEATLAALQDRFADIMTTEAILKL